MDSETPAAPIGRCRPVRYRGPMRMRRADREITDPVALRDIVAAAEVGHLGLMDDEGIYVVPLSFVHTVREDGRDTVYVHGAPEGRKVSAITARPDAVVCFQTEVRHATIGLDDPNLEHLSVWYESVIGWGKARLVDDPDEALVAGALLVEKYAPGRGHELRALPPNVLFLAIDLEQMSGKARQP